MIELVINEATPSLNRFLGEDWRCKIKHRKRWAWLVRAARLQAKIYAPPKYPRATLTIERYGAKKLDADNCRGGMKFLTDSLVREGFIQDDSMDHIGEPVIRQILSKERKTIIRIEPS